LVDENGGSTAIKENKNIEFDVFPNPTNGIIFLSQNPNVKSEINVYDIFGKQILTKEFNYETDKFNLSHLENGVYFLTLENKDGFKTKKITISK
jgi:hypothetical protein